MTISYPNMKTFFVISKNNRAKGWRLEESANEYSMILFEKKMDAERHCGPDETVTVTTLNQSIKQAIRVKGIGYAIMRANGDLLLDVDLA